MRRTHSGWWTARMSSQAAGGASTTVDARQPLHRLAG
jgi:hypothetical protein